MTELSDVGDKLVELLRGARRAVAGTVEPNRYLLAIGVEPTLELRHRLADAGVELAVQSWLPKGTAFVIDKVAVLGFPDPTIDLLRPSADRDRVARPLRVA